MLSNKVKLMLSWYPHVQDVELLKFHQIQYPFTAAAVWNSRIIIWQMATSYI